MIGQRVDCARLACIGTPDERNFFASVQGQISDVIDGGKKRSLRK
jgi:hypothetical protein